MSDVISGTDQSAGILPILISFDAQSRALSRKVTDEFTVPLCRSHHRELHRFAAERFGGIGLGLIVGSCPSPMARVASVAGAHPTP
jgi:hypothetical protein